MKNHELAKIRNDDCMLLLLNVVVMAVEWCVCVCVYAIPSELRKNHTGKNMDKAGSIHPILPF